MIKYELFVTIDGKVFSYGLKNSYEEASNIGIEKKKNKLIESFRIKQERVD